MANVKDETGETIVFIIKYIDLKMATCSDIDVDTVIEQVARAHGRRLVGDVPARMPHRAADGVTAIPVSRGEYVIVDDEDACDLRDYTWHLSGGQAARSYWSADHGKSRKYYLARELLRVEEPGLAVLFLNGDPLDCRRENLAVVPRVGGTRSRE
jgi:hypothetical protein